jgi:hypothetical protein
MLELRCSMSQSVILSKLQRELQLDITTERQVVYILVEIRKAIEQARELAKYFALDFYCSFALHTKMDRAGAKRILERFDKAYPILAQKQKLPPNLRNEIQQTIKLDKFRREMKAFLTSNDLPLGLVEDSDVWVDFIRLYANVIDECALVLKAGNLQAIDRVSVHLEMATKTLDTEFGEEALFRIRWTSHGKDGLSGSHDVYFGFSPRSLP